MNLLAKLNYGESVRINRNLDGESFTISLYNKVTNIGIDRKVSVYDLNQAYSSDAVFNRIIDDMIKEMREFGEAQ